MSDDTITISVSEYIVLIDDSKKLAALEAAGVENWEGYEFAMEIYSSDDE